MDLQQTETQEKPKKTSPARKGTKYIYKHHVTAESRKAARAAAEASGTVDATRRQQIYSYNTGRNLCLGPNFARDSLHRAIANRGQGTA